MAANFRIIYDNAANRGTLSASSQASASLAVGNLLTDLKGQVWRSSSAAAASTVLTLTNPTAMQVGGVAAAYSNLTVAATMRVQVYTLSTDSSPAFDSGHVLACPAAAIALSDWGAGGAGVNAYAYGGGACGRQWFTHVSGQKIVISIVDTANPAGYVEVGRLIVGRFWEGVRNIDYGVALSIVDTTKNFRNDAGDLLSDVGTRHRKLTAALSNLASAERSTLWNILWGNGMSSPMFLSVFPNADDTALEQAHQGWFKLMSSPAMAMPSFAQCASSLELEEV